MIHLTTFSQNLFLSHPVLNFRLLSPLIDGDKYISDWSFFPESLLIAAQLLTTNTTAEPTMSNAKYTPAPQQDPDDVPAGPAYSQAPPSYQAADDEARLFAGEGAPRSSEDNVPDDFKFGGSVAEATIDIRNQFVRKVYTILTVQLLATGAVSTISFVSPAYKEWIQGHPALVFISVCRVPPRHLFVCMY